MEEVQGGDATEMMLHYIDNPALFETPEMKRISEMPMGLTRSQYQAVPRN